MLEKYNLDYNSESQNHRLTRWAEPRNQFHLLFSPFYFNPLNIYWYLKYLTIIETIGEVTILLSCQLREYCLNFMQFGGKMACLRPKHCYRRVNVKGNTKVTMSTVCSQQNFRNQRTFALHNIFKMILQKNTFEQRKQRHSFWLSNNFKHIFQSEWSDH